MTRAGNAASLEVLARARSRPLNRAKYCVKPGSSALFRCPSAGPRLMISIRTHHCCLPPPTRPTGRRLAARAAAGGPGSGGQEPRSPGNPLRLPEALPLALAAAVPAGGASAARPQQGSEPGTSAGKPAAADMAPEAQPQPAAGWMPPALAEMDAQAVAAGVGAATLERWAWAYRQVRCSHWMPASALPIPSFPASQPQPAKHIPPCRSIPLTPPRAAELWCCADCLPACADGGGRARPGHPRLCHPAAAHQPHRG